MKRCIKHRRWRVPLTRDGTAAVEFAIVAPVLILLVLGVAVFGIYLSLLHEVQELASSGARASVAGVTPQERNSLAQNFISAYVASSGLIIPADLTVTTSTTGSPPTSYQVSVAYNLKDTPIPLLAAIVPVPTTSIQRTATVQFGGY